MSAREKKLDEKLLDITREFRKGILNGNSSKGMCFMVCAPLEGFLSFNGIKASLVEGALPSGNHFWLRLEDGRVLDPTADQFNEELNLDLPEIYLGQPAKIHHGYVDAAVERAALSRSAT